MLKKVVADWLTSVWYIRSTPPTWLRALVPVYRHLRAKRIASAQEAAGAKPSVPIIVVGNLVVGGSGKTPVVARVVAACRQAGYQVAVISRGYGGSECLSKNQDAVLVRTDSNPKKVGDEPVLLAKQTGAEVWVGRDRQAAVACAVAANAEVVVCDDGLQHPHLQSSYTLCLIDGERGFGNGYLLPAGPLREPIERLDAIDQILIKAGDFHIKHPYTRFELLPQDLMRVSDGQSVGVRALEGQAVVALCAIAHPHNFRSTLEGLGMKVSLSAWPDHHAFSAKDLIKADQGGPIVVTEKDWVKIERLILPEALRSQIYVLRVEAQVDRGVLDAVVEHVREFRNHD